VDLTLPRGGVEACCACRDGPVTQGRSVNADILLGEPDDELRDGLTFSVVAPDSKGFYRPL
jgi:hypothetical protein